MFCFIFIFGCSENKEIGATDNNAAKQVAVSFVQALIDKDYTKAHSLMSKEFKTKKSQEQLKHDFEEMLNVFSLSHQQLYIESNKIVSDKAADGTTYYSFPIGKYKYEDIDGIVDKDIEFTTYISKEDNKLVVNGFMQ